MSSLSLSLFLGVWVACSVFADPQPGAPATSTVLQLTTMLRAKVKPLGSTAGMRSAFESLCKQHGLKEGQVSYEEFVLIRLLFEATRDAGLWNLHWTITDQQPNSDNIWRQWKGATGPLSYSKPTASGECDELSALFAFLATKVGVRGVGLLWPAANHTVAVWTVHPRSGPVIRVVVPTSQIFLDENDMFDTLKFDPWKQKTIYDYTRRDVADSFEMPAALVQFFLRQIDRYAGASDSTLQRLRYLREAVFLKWMTPQEAAAKTIGLTAVSEAIPGEDLEALSNFAVDMRNLNP